MTDYPHANALNPKPNTSTLPRGAWTGMVWALLIELAISAAYVFGKMAWRLL